MVEKLPVTIDSKGEHDCGARSRIELAVEHTKEGRQARATYL